MKKISVSVLLLVLANLVLGGFILYYMNSKPKAVFVQLSKLYSEFKMKKELEQKLLDVNTKRELMLDSMEVVLKSLSSQLNSPSVTGRLRETKIQEFEYRRRDFIQQKETFSQEAQRVSAAYDEQIWKQLNQYLSDFGKENKYAMILGADGSGGLMYAEEQMDITADLITFVNQKYKGN